MTKYRSKRCSFQGLNFDSILEKNVYIELLRIARKGKITRIDVQVPFDLHSNSGKKVCCYRADFLVKLHTGEPVIVEAKGVKTAIYTLKKKMMMADYPFRFVEIFGEDLKKVELILLGY